MKTMKMLRTGLMFGSLGISAACGSTEPTSLPVPPEPLECVASPRFKPLDGIHGTGGTNGLDAELFHLYFNDLFKATEVALTETKLPMKGPYPLNPMIAAGLLKEGDYRATRKAIFDHAIQCALPVGTTLLDAEMEPHTGGGVLRTTGGWLQKGLDDAARNDLFTCMAILLNPDFQNIPVFMSGPSVHECATSTPLYPFTEAIWAANVTELGVLYYVWPLFTGPYLPDCRNENEMKDAFRYRLCGTTEGYCDIDLRKDETECKPVARVPDETCEPSEDELEPDSGHFQCSVNGDLTPMNAIKTRLMSSCWLKFLYCPSPK